MSATAYFSSTNACIMQKMRSNASRSIQRICTIQIVAAVFFVSMSFYLNEAPSSAATSGCPSKTCSSLAGLIKAGSQLTAVPGNLQPALSQASMDLHVPAGGLCQSLNDGQIGPHSAYQPCYFGDAKVSGKRVLLLGDNTAENWSAAIDPAAVDAGDNFTLLYHSSCRITLNVNLLPPQATYAGAPTPAQCLEWINAAVEFINDFNPQILVVAASDLLPAKGQNTFSTGLVNLIYDLAAPGRRIYIMGNIPDLGRNSVSCLGLHLSDPSACSTPLSVAESTSAEHSLQKVANETHSILVNVEPWTCTKKVCPAVIGHFDVYADQYDLTSTYAEFLKPLMEKVLKLNK